MGLEFLKEDDGNLIDSRKKKRILERLLQTRTVEGVNSTVFILQCVFIGRKVQITT